jgi:PAS domain S-box-containing protein
VAEITDTPKIDQAGASVPVESILCTEELRQRPARTPDYEKENRALVALAKVMADSPRTVLQSLAETLLDLCNAGSAGVSLLTKEDGGQRFYWPAIAGAWKPHIGGGTPRNFGPCGDVLDRNMTLLFGRINKRYTYFEPVQPAVEEAILVPFYVEGKAVGTIWAVAHDKNRKFDAEDERMMQSLGSFASSAYQTLLSLDALEMEASERRVLEKGTNLLAAIVDSSDDAIVSKTLDGTITSWNKSAEQLFGHTAQEAVGQHIFLVIPPDRRSEETEIIERVTRGERVVHFETIRLRKDGTPVEVSLSISPVKDTNGTIVGASKIARDISVAKRAEQALRESEERLRNLSESLDGQVRARTSELERRNEELRALSSRLLTTQDDERRHIARELHDSAGQIVAALSMTLGAIAARAEQPTLAKPLEDAQELTQQLNREIRTTSYLLHPPLLDESGLAQAMDWYVQGLAERSGLKVELCIDAGLGRLPSDMELAVFRIVQESLTNVHRHSGSKTAEVKLSRDPEKLWLTIADHGHGISSEKLANISARRTGVGIAGMRERVRHFGGEMKIESNEAGAQILISLPIPEGTTLEP